LHNFLALPFCAAAFITAAQSPASAAPMVRVELNKLETVEKDCRATLVVSNSGEQAYSELRLDLVVFDKESIVAKRLIVDVAPLAAEKTSVKSFDIAGLPCNDISRVLLNDVPACGGDACLGQVETSSRAENTPFDK